MNYFFVHTPFQLIVAQGIIKLNGLKKNTILLGHTGKNVSRQNLIIQNILIKSLWDKVYFIGDLHTYVPRLSNLKTFFQANSALSKLNDKIEKKVSAHLFFGDLNSIAYIIMIKYLKSERISFFEEGLAHYNLAILKPKSNADVLKRVAYNFLCKNIMSVRSISKFIFNDKPSNFDFKIEKRYNILKRENLEFYDEPLDLKEILKQGINTNFKKTFNALKEVGNCVIFLSSTIRNIFDDAIETEINIVKKISNLYPYDHIFIKFHPKDNIALNKKIIDIIKKRSINASELNIESEVPIEILFDVIKPKSLFGYGSSSQLYFTQISKNIPNKNVLELLDITYVEKQKRSLILLKIIKNWAKLENTYL